ncbi:MAG: DUF1015 domain-containing protein [Magnetococcales bacterium]|nr:DUF1015 domain-containing protein [Magnetococcales bacterium]
MVMQPFQGWRPLPALAADVASPPYDVLNRQEAARMAAGNARSFLHVSKAEIDLPDDVAADDVRVYARAGETFAAFCREGVLRRDETPCFYVYGMSAPGVEQTGLVGAVSVAAYLDNRVRKHEHTRPDKVQDRTRLAEALGAHTGPVLLVNRRHAALESLLAECRTGPAELDVMARDGVRHRLWVVSEAGRVSGLAQAIEEAGDLYVADGHHRSAAATAVCQSRVSAGHPCPDEAPWGRFMAVCFPDHQMRILDYNRVVRDLHGHSVEGFLEALRQSFELEASPRAVKPVEAHCFGMFLAGKWWRLRLKESLAQESDPVAALDVSLLSRHVLEPLLGITDPRRDSRIDFVGGARGTAGLEARVVSGEMQVAFSLFPTGLADLMAVADAGQVMPPKSTWFEPKLLDGLVLQTF